MSVVKLVIDFECPAPDWWEGGGRELWHSIAEGFDNNAVLLEESIAKSVVLQAASLDGWEGGGNEYSPHPLRIDTVDEDEET
jgi:hypothetical protein